MTTYTDVFTSSTIYASDVDYNSIALSVDKTLSWPLDANPGDTLAAKIIDVTPSTSGLSITLPDATRASTAKRFCLITWGRALLRLKVAEVLQF